jgi:hypothetical protein
MSDMDKDIDFDIIESYKYPSILLYFTKGSLLAHRRY